VNPERRERDERSGIATNGRTTPGSRGVHPLKLAKACLRRFHFPILILAVMQTGISHGRLLPEESFPSAWLGTQRVVRVYLPPSYDTAPERRYPVLYLHDGQNVFSSAGPGAAFGWGPWDLDATADQLSSSSRMSEIIMVAIDNSRFRYTEYRGLAYPYSTVELAGLKQKPSAPGDNTRFNQYARFLIEELKPSIDRRFRTRPGPAHTGVMGSSMGGLCSLALAWEHPGVFGLAACMSGSFQVERTNFLSNVLRPHREKSKPVRIYLDSGVIDFTGGDDGCRNTLRVAEELRRIGWRDGIDLSFFVHSEPLSEAEIEGSPLPREKWPEARTSQHNEFYWRHRAWRALTFLFP
jgi:predicted alpha/beta superfamily hydrolase